jgi:hypothetical protein
LTWSSTVYWIVQTWSSTVYWIVQTWSSTVYWILQTVRLSRKTWSSSNNNMTIIWFCYFLKYSKSNFRHNILDKCNRNDWSNCILTIDVLGLKMGLFTAMEVAETTWGPHWPNRVLTTPPHLLRVLTTTKTACENFISWRWCCQKKKKSNVRL